MANFLMNQPLQDETSTWQALLAEGRAAEALAQYRRSENADETVYDTLDTLATMQNALREKGYARAVRALNKLERRPDLIDWDRLEADLLRVQTGAAEVGKNLVEEALATLSPVANPLLSAEVETLRGTAQVIDNQVELAKAHFERAVAADPKNYRAITNLGNLALEAGDVDAAIAAYEKALTLNDSFGNAHHNLGVAYRRKGQVGKSVRSLRKAQGASQKQLRDEARESLRGSVSGGLPNTGAGSFTWSSACWFIFCCTRGALCKPGCKVRRREPPRRPTPSRLTSSFVRAHKSQPPGLRTSSQYTAVSQ